MKSLPFACLVLLTLSASRLRAVDAPSYAQVHAIFAQHCLTCHDSAKDPEANLSLNSHEALLKGGDDGAVLVPHKPEESLLLQQIEHKKKPFMPPPKKGDNLSDENIALIRAWILAGAAGPQPGEILASTTAPSLPKILPTVMPRRAIQSLAFNTNTKVLAVARPNEIDLRAAGDVYRSARKLPTTRGALNDIVFTADGTKLIAGAGKPGVSGEVQIFNAADGSLLRSISGHKDAIYSLAISPDGHTLATGSYDQKIILWSLDDGKQIRELVGHNGSIFALSFRNDGKVLASASADRTVKLWDVATGNRLDTRSEPSKDLYTLAFSPDGKRLAAGSADNRIRIWQISESGAEGTNPIRVSQFAHEGTVLKVVWSPDGKTLASSADDKSVKLWDASSSDSLKQRLTLAIQPDWPTALAFVNDAKTLAVGRQDGSLAFYDATTGAEQPPPKPEAVALDPAGLQRGQTSRINLIGKNLSALSAVTVKSPDGKLTAKLLALDTDRPELATIELSAAADLPATSYEVTVTGTGGMSAPLKVFVEDIPQIHAQPTAAGPIALPASVWGRFIQAGSTFVVQFDAKAKQPIVLDAAAQRLGSKATALLTVLDESGKPVMSGSRFNDDADALLVFIPPTDGRYTLRISDVNNTASDQHFFRVSVGQFQVVTGTFPLAIPANTESMVHLVGLNVPADTTVKLKAGAAGEMELPTGAFRTRAPVKVIVSETPELTETEPNDQPAQSSALPVPGSVSGIINAPGDADLYRFAAKANQNYVVETLASRRGSPCDTRIEILHTDGRPVDRVQLVAVRDSYINFRAIDGNGSGARFQNYEEMQLNQFMYMSGEVVRLFLEPRGPDSEYNFYVATNGKRRCYFDTTASSHALDEKTYIVEPHALSESIPPTGLPIFRLHYENDDDADRILGSDSRLIFTPPADGEYLVRVTDTRNLGGERFTYRLTVRPAKPDFTVTADGFNGAIPAGSGRPFTLRADRTDGYDGPIRVELSGAPAGFTVSSPVIIEAGQLTAMATLFAAADAPAPTKENGMSLKAVATAATGPQPTTKPVMGIGKVSLAPKPAAFAILEPSSAASTRPIEITITQGKLTPATLKLQRNGQTGPITFDVENLPHGVIVADIGLNGVLIPEGQSERQIFFACPAWVSDTDRPIYAKIREAGNPTSTPVLLRVRRATEATAAPK